MHVTDAVDLCSIRRVVAFLVCVLWLPTSARAQSGPEQAPQSQTPGAPRSGAPGNPPATPTPTTTVPAPGSTPASAPRAAPRAPLAPRVVQQLNQQAEASFASGDFTGALRTWNRVNGPTIGTIDFKGLKGSSEPSMRAAVGLTPRTLLTAGLFLRTQRRAEDLPSATTTTVRYQVSRAVARVEVDVAERSHLPDGALGWGSVIIGALFTREIRLPIVNPAGRGDAIEFAYRFDSPRQRVFGGYTTPSIGGLALLTRVDATVERETYATLGSRDSFRVSRRRVGGSVGQWTSGWLFWRGGAAVDRIDDTLFTAVSGQLNMHALDDRIAVIATGERWATSSTSGSFTTRELVVSARSSTVPGTAGITATVGVSDASRNAPPVVWPGADSGRGRLFSLRAHPLFKKGRLTGETFGRRVAGFTVEYERPLAARDAGAITVVGFLDSARAWRRLDDTSGRLLTDVGTGIRLRTRAGSIRLDLAVGLRDKAARLSAGYLTTWGRR